jgi:hypothetical protein
MTGFGTMVLHFPSVRYLITMPQYYLFLILGMKRLDQGHLHPLLEHPEKNVSRAGIEPGPSLTNPTLKKNILNLHSAILFLAVQRANLVEHVRVGYIFWIRI